MDCPTDNGANLTHKKRGHLQYNPDENKYSFDNTSFVTTALHECHATYADTDTEIIHLTNLTYTIK